MKMRKLATIATLAGALALGACMNTGEVNRSLESVHQPVVRISNYALDADASNGILSPSEARRVSDWLDAMEVRYGDQIAIDASAASSVRGARDTVAMMLARKGLLLAEHAPLTEGVIAPGNIRIVISRASARVPGCPDWGTRSATEHRSITTSNYGCATNSNLAAMVANPNDLIAGQSATSNDPATASRAIEAYRAATPTGAGGLSSASSASGGGSGGAGGGSSGGGQ